MGISYVLLLSVAAVLVVVNIAEDVQRPNIVFIIADDLGWDDVSFHGSDQIATPNIDLLAYSGVALERYYSHSICTPSRAALLTGKYAYRLGMQGYPLTCSEDRGLPVTEKLLPEYFRDLGYATHLVGKWHTGGSRSEYLPTNRGFDTYFGHISGYVDYYEYLMEETWSTGKVAGMSMYRNTTAAWDVKGYLTDVYTEEAVTIIKDHDESKPLFLNVAHMAPHSANDGAQLQAPLESMRAMRHVEMPDRRIYAAMVKKLDESVGTIMEALLEKGILENTIVVFVSDNGGMTSGNSMNYASNWPLRGLKMSPFEGGVRVAGLLWTPTLSQHLWKGYMHVVDWLPTLLKAAGADVPEDIDGIDLWSQIISNETTTRTEMFEIDDYTGYSAIISGDYKLVTGNVKLAYSDFQGDSLRGVIGNAPSYEDEIKDSKMYSVLEQLGNSFDMSTIDIRYEIKINCTGSERNSTDACYPQNGTVCLFNIKDDPCETIDLSESYPDLVTNMTERLQVQLDSRSARTVPLYRDPRSAPKLFNYTWTTFADSF